MRLSITPEGNVDYTEDLFCLTHDIADGWQFVEMLLVRAHTHTHGVSLGFVLCMNGVDSYAYHAQHSTGHRVPLIADRQFDTP